ncbi:hypothetical protein F4811DRAFT_557395 [Daldinia bambusicola]|nr:hypothetical protein F4811DRAFT_557395 [Daldinia bambusicola]
MVLATIPFSLAQQADPTCLPVPTTLVNTTIVTPTQTSANITTPSTNNTSLVVQAADAPKPSSSMIPGPLRIIDEDPVYKYVGCWSEITLLDPETHALDGPYLTAPGLMNVRVCVNFCRHAANKKALNHTGFRYAGLEYAYQCWCGDHLSTHSYHVLDSVCDLPCAGANTTACGGHLAMTLYNVTEKTAPGDNDGFGNGHGNGTVGGGVGGGNLPKGPDGQAALQAVGVGFLVLAVTFALGWGCL